MFDAHTMSQASALAQVIGIDIVLAGDNAVVVGMAAAGLPKELRARAIMIGIVAAMLMRVAFALVTAQLMTIVGLMVAGGVLLLWVAWKLWRELREQAAERAGVDAITEEDADAAPPGGQKTLRQAVIQILLADLTMSLDNVLAVAGAAHEHPYIMAFGLVLSIALMGVAATWIARLLDRHRWIAYVGLALIVYVALHMIWDGGQAIAVAM